jgi:hypothetical protein
MERDSNRGGLIKGKLKTVESERFRLFFTESRPVEMNSRNSAISV